MNIKDQYRKQAIPLIQAVIIEQRNEVDDLKVQQAITKVFPWHKTNLVAHLIWYKEVAALRLYYYKKKNFKGYE